MGYLSFFLVFTAGNTAAQCITHGLVLYSIQHLCSSKRLQLNLDLGVSDAIFSHEPLARLEKSWHPGVRGTCG